MPVSTQLFQFCKGIEHFYYTLLFVNDRDYARNATTWESWLQLGFHLSVKMPPPAARQQDILMMETRSNGKNFEIRATSANQTTLQRLHDLLGDIDKLRQAMKGKDEAAKDQAVLSDSRIQQRLVSPLKEALNNHQFSKTDVDAFSYMLQRGLRAMTDEEIMSVALTLASPVR
jgi:hypothetical protein